MVGHVENGILVGNGFIVNGEAFTVNRIGDSDLYGTRIVFTAVRVGVREHQMLAAVVASCFHAPCTAVVADNAAVEMVAAGSLVLCQLVFGAVQRKAAAADTVGVTADQRALIAVGGIVALNRVVTADEVNTLVAELLDNAAEVEYGGAERVIAEFVCNYKPSVGELVKNGNIHGKIPFVFCYG